MSRPSVIPARYWLVGCFVGPQDGVLLLMATGKAQARAVRGCGGFHPRPPARTLRRTSVGGGSHPRMCPTPVAGDEPPDRAPPRRFRWRGPGRPGCRGLPSLPRLQRDRGRTVEADLLQRASMPKCRAGPSPRQATGRVLARGGGSGGGDLPGRGEENARGPLSRRRADGGRAAVSDPRTRRDQGRRRACPGSARRGAAERSGLWRRSEGRPEDRVFRARNDGRRSGRAR